MGWDRVSLADAMIARMAEEEVRVVCFRLHVDYENLDRKTKKSLIISLIEYMEHRGEFDSLTRQVEDLRPDIKPPSPRPTPTPPVVPVEPQSKVGRNMFGPWMIVPVVLVVGAGILLFRQFGQQPALGSPRAIQVPVGTLTPALTEITRPTPAPLQPRQTQPPAGKAIPPVTPNTQWVPEFQSFDGVDMALVPPGCFILGTQNPPPGREDEKPIARICFDKPFWIDKTEVTQAQFRRLGGKVAKTARFVGDNRPVENITWFEARDFCTKRGARLPTEAEWEYAARGPDNLVYPWGNNFDGNKVVYIGNSGGQTADVGSRPSGASWVGALDMSGNVWEWISSLYRPYPYKENDGRENLEDTGKRVVRGGSWANIEGDLQAANHSDFAPSEEEIGIGFRCARSS